MRHKLHLLSVTGVYAGGHRNSQRDLGGVKESRSRWNFLKKRKERAWREPQFGKEDGERERAEAGSRKMEQKAGASFRVVRYRHSGIIDNIASIEQMFKQ
ncbi:MAG: hypothetical protein D6679_08890 [Candidatus Hydrogenedentota bacterium]|nr:MAG: hypothetical protein D6679_08890 [Candidatus Hydrogenedentota bacterium]